MFGENYKNISPRVKVSVHYAPNKERTSGHTRPSGAAATPRGPGKYLTTWYCCTRGRSSVHRASLSCSYWTSRLMVRGKCALGGSRGRGDILAKFSHRRPGSQQELARPVLFLSAAPIPPQSPGVKMGEGRGRLHPLAPLAKAPVATEPGDMGGHRAWEHGCRSRGCINLPASAPAFGPLLPGRGWGLGLPPESLASRWPGKGKDGLGGVARGPGHSRGTPAGGRGWGAQDWQSMQCCGNPTSLPACSASFPL